MDSKKLTPREETILNTIVRDYVVSAEPTGSRTISKKATIELSPASIRIVLSDLEEKGLVSQPHTSAGRIPTDKGFRYYVDNLLTLPKLTNREKEAIHAQIEQAHGSYEKIASMTSKVLSSMTQELGVVLAPRFDKGIFKRLDFVEVAENRVMLVLTIESGLVNTVIAEMETALSAPEIAEGCNFLNQRLGGRKLADIKTNLGEMVFTDDAQKIGTVRLFVDKTEDLFTFPQDKTLHTDGTKQLLVQPEFFDKDRLQTVIELVENKRILIHLLDGLSPKEGVFVSIGGENDQGELQSYSVVTSNYKAGNVTGTLGVLGPTRMPYPKLISVVDYTAQVLSKKL